MKTILATSSILLPTSLSGKSSLVVFGLFVLIVSIQRTSGATLVHVSTPPPAPIAVRLALGSINVVVSSTIASTSVDSATGQLRAGGDGAAQGALNVLRARSGEPALDMAFAVFAPIGAAVGATRAPSVRLSPETLDEAHQDVVNAIRELARPELLRELFLKTARERTRRSFVTDGFPSSPDNPALHDPNRATLTLSVEDCRLSRSTPSDTSFALVIRTRARLIRTMDGATLYDQPFEFRSGQCLFIDWTLNHAQPLRKVAETGYRHLAAGMVQQLFLSSPQGALLVGSGVPSPKRAPGSKRGMMMAAQRPQASTRNSTQPVVNLSSGDIGIYSNPSVLHVATPSPVTRDDAVREAREDVDSDLDGLQNFPNPLISLPAILSAIPLSIYRQTVAGFRGMSTRKAAAIETALRRAQDDRILHQELSQELASQLETKTIQTVMLLPGPLRAAEEAGFVRVGLGRRINSPDWSSRKASRDYLVNQKIGTVMEIQVVRSGLKGGEQINASQSLEVEAWIRVRRADDGLELHAFPIQYRSRRHSLSDWAAQDARIFRRELDQCSRDIAAAMSETLLACGVVSPSSKEARPMLAGPLPSR